MTAEIRKISNEEYHADKTHVSASRLKLAFKSMRHYANPEPSVHKKAFDLGNVFEYYLTDKASFFQNVFVYSEDRRPDKTMTMAANVNKAWKAKIEQENVGKIIIKNDEYEMIKSMVEECERHPAIMGLIKKADFQISIFFTDKNGLKTKARPDLVIWVDEKTVIVIDIKSTKDASEEGFRKDCQEYHYPFQAIIQILGLEALGVFVDTYYWLAAEKSDHLPMAQLYEFLITDQVALKIAHDSVSKKVIKYNETGNAPGYEEGCDNEFGVKALPLSDYYIKKMRNA